MLERNLRILQLIMMKSGPRMEALINDPQSQDLDVLLIQEPSITTYRIHVNHSAWRLYRPTTQLDADRIRSLIYVNRHISTSSHRQIFCDHPDIAPIKIWTVTSQILLFLSTYRQYHFSLVVTHRRCQRSLRFRAPSQLPPKTSSARPVSLCPATSIDTTRCGAAITSRPGSSKTPAT